MQILSDWDEITSENLRRWLAHHKNNLNYHRNLENSYWIAKMRSVAAEG